MTEQEMMDFMQDQALTARCVVQVLQGEGERTADNVLTWVSRDGMIGNALAVTVATHVYSRYVAKANSTKDTIITDLLGYYQTLGKSLVKAGVQI
jgi:hypothetical protein